MERTAPVGGSLILRAWIEEGPDLRVRVVAVDTSGNEADLGTESSIAGVRATVEGWLASLLDQG